MTMLINFTENVCTNFCSMESLDFGGGTTLLLKTLHTDTTLTPRNHPPNSLPVVFGANFRVQHPIGAEI